MLKIQFYIFFVNNFKEYCPLKYICVGYIFCWYHFWTNSFDLEALLTTCARPNRAHHSKLGGFKTFEWFQTTLQNGENFTGSQILPKSNYSVWPFLNHCSTPRLCLSHVLMCQESNFREELLVWIVKIQITETLRREIIFSLGWYILLPNISRRF